MSSFTSSDSLSVDQKTTTFSERSSNDEGVSTLRMNAAAAKALKGMSSDISSLLNAVPEKLASEMLSGRVGRSSRTDSKPLVDVSLFGDDQGAVPTPSANGGGSVAALGRIIPTPIASVQGATNASLASVTVSSTTTTVVSTTSLSPAPTPTRRSSARVKSAPVVPVKMEESEAEDEDVEADVDVDVTNTPRRRSSRVVAAEEAARVQAEKDAKEAEKAAKKAEKDAEKAAKLAEKEAEKARKEAEKEAEIAAEKAEKEAVKARKEAEKETKKKSSSRSRSRSSSTSRAKPSRSRSVSRAAAPKDDGLVAEKKSSSQRSSRARSSARETTQKAEDNQIPASIPAVSSKSSGVKSKSATSKSLKPEANVAHLAPAPMTDGESDEEIIAVPISRRSSSVKKTSTADEASPSKTGRSPSRARKAAILSSVLNEKIETIDDTADKAEISRKLKQKLVDEPRALLSNKSKGKSSAGRTKYVANGKSSKGKTLATEEAAEQSPDEAVGIAKAIISRPKTPAKRLVVRKSNSTKVPRHDQEDKSTQTSDVLVVEAVKAIETIVETIVEKPLTSTRSAPISRRISLMPAVAPVESQTSPLSEPSFFVRAFYGTSDKANFSQPRVTRRARVEMEKTDEMTFEDDEATLKPMKKARVGAVKSATSQPSRLATVAKSILVTTPILAAATAATTYHVLGRFPSVEEASSIALMLKEHGMVWAKEMTAKALSHL